MALKNLTEAQLISLPTTLPSHCRVHACPEGSRTTIYFGCAVRQDLRAGEESVTTGDTVSVGP